MEKARHALYHRSDLTAHEAYQRDRVREPGARSRPGGPHRKTPQPSRRPRKHCFSHLAHHNTRGLPCIPILPQALKILSREEPPMRDPRIPGGPRAPRAGYAGTAPGEEPAGPAT